MLDGDKIAALVAGFIVDLVKTATLDSEIKVGVVQTAYANGSSTKYLAEVTDSRISVLFHLLTSHISVSQFVVSQRVSNTFTMLPSALTSGCTLKRMGTVQSCFRLGRWRSLLPTNQLPLPSRPH